MVKEVMETLDMKSDGTYLDATVGLGGHAEEILKRLGEEGRLIGTDRDNEALRRSKERLGNKRVILARGRFSELKELLPETGFNEVDGVLFDFGVSMMQFRDMGRGFSFSSDEPLDMRMDSSQGLKAGDIVNTYPEKEIEKILREYGEEWLAPKIARSIAAYRNKKKISTCSVSLSFSDFWVSSSLILYSRVVILDLSQTTAKRLAIMRDKSNGFTKYDNTLLRFL